MQERNSWRDKNGELASEDMYVIIIIYINFCFFL